MITSPVRAITLIGKVKVYILRFFLFLCSIVKGSKWTYPLKNFEENPKYFSLADSLYLAYKYYYKSMMRADKHSCIEDYFRSQKFSPIKAEGNLTISLGGDLIPYEYINDTTCDSLWNECGSYFFSSDIVFANLETPIDRSKRKSLVPEVMLKSMLFNADEEIFNIFNGQGKYKGFDVLSVANNHSLDQGENGLLNTLDFLEEKKIAYCGARKSENDGDGVAIITKNGIRTAFIAFTFSFNDFDLPPDKIWMCNHTRLNKEGVDVSKIIKQATSAMENGADIIIASLHMGNAYQAYPSKHIIDTVHRICDQAKIDVVVVSHPHNAQPIEWYEHTIQEKLRRTLIFYSLGDFVAYDIYTLTHLSLLVRLHIYRKGNEVIVDGFEILPVYMMAIFNGRRINKLIFTHIEKARKHKSINTTFSQVESFFRNTLFTQSQRDAIINK